MSGIWVPMTKKSMGRIKQFYVQFEGGDNATFYCGQVVQGAMIIHVEEDVSIRSIYVHFFGETHTFWVNKTSDKIYESRESYFNSRIDLPYLNQSSDGELLPRGIHSLPFSYQLPENIPSAFEGEYGYTRYICTARIELIQPSCFMGSISDAEFQVEKPFNVSPHVGPSIPAAYAEPVRRGEVIDIIGCLGKKGAVEIQLILSKPEYHIGEQLTATVTVNNVSKAPVKGIEFLLFQHTRFQAISRYESVADHKEMNRVVDSVGLGTLGASKSQTWPTAIIVPQIPPTQVGHIIGIAYWAKVICKDAIEVTAPVTILSRY